MRDFVSELKGTLVLPSLLYCSRAKPIIHEARHGLFSFLIDYLENAKEAKRWTTDRNYIRDPETNDILEVEYLKETIIDTTSTEGYIRTANEAIAKLKELQEDESINVINNFVDTIQFDEHGSLRSRMLVNGQHAGQEYKVAACENSFKFSIDDECLNRPTNITVSFSGVDNNWTGKMFGPLVVDYGFELYVNTDGYWINLIIGRHRVSLVENTKKYITDEQKAFVRKNIFNLKD